MDIHALWFGAAACASKPLPISNLDASFTLLQAILLLLAVLVALNGPSYLCLVYLIYPMCFCRWVYRACEVVDVRLEPPGWWPRHTLGLVRDQCRRGKKPPFKLPSTHRPPPPPPLLLLLNYYHHPTHPSQPHERILGITYMTPPSILPSLFISPLLIVITCFLPRYCSFYNVLFNYVETAPLLPSRQPSSIHLACHFHLFLFFSFLFKYIRTYVVCVLATSSLFPAHHSQLPHPTTLPLKLHPSSFIIIIILILSPFRTRSPN